MLSGKIMDASAAAVVAVSGAAISKQPPVPEPLFSRTVELDGSEVGDTAFNLPDIPDGTAYLDVVVDIAGGDDDALSGDGVLRLDGAYIVVELSNGGRIPASVGRVESLNEPDVLPSAVVATARGSVFPPQSQFPVVSIEWDTVAATLERSGLVDDTDFPWTITVEIHAIPEG